MATRFYKVLKATPAFEKGAILTGDSSYAPTKTLFMTEAAEAHSGYCEVKSVVENSPEWFERVYEVLNANGGKQYLTRDKAQALALKDLTD